MYMYQTSKIPETIIFFYSILYTELRNKCSIVDANKWLYYMIFSTTYLFYWSPTVLVPENNKMYVLKNWIELNWIERWY